MVLNEKQAAEFERISRFMIEWLNGNCHPHVEVIIGPNRAELLEGVRSFTTDDYIKD